MRDAPSRAPTRCAAFGRLGVVALSLLTAGCVNLAPGYERPSPPVPGAFDTPSVTGEAPVAGTASASAAPAATEAAALGWRQFFTDDRLRRLVALTLDRNRDLRAATLNIERARALYGVEDAARWPSLNGSASGTRQRQAADVSSSGRSQVGASYGVSVNLPAYEIDFFSRVRNLSDAALQSYYATEAAQRSTQITLVADVATAWLRLAADVKQLQLARQTFKSREDGYGLTRRAYELGGQSGLTLIQAQTAVDAARVAVAAYSASVAQSRHALALLAGGPVPDELLPGDDDGEVAVLLEVPAGLPSTLLTQRPDVIAAEHALIASHAQIGAARAAFFPRITLTASAGTASRSLGDLFASRNNTWSFSPGITVPIFDGGANRANLRVAEVDRDLRLASYEKTLQVAFREVADALSTRGTLGEQLAAQRSLVEATGKSLSLSQARFKGGAESYLEVLDAQRSLYTAQQTLIDLQLAEQANRLTLYRVLGGGWTADDVLADRATSDGGGAALR